MAVATETTQLVGGELAWSRLRGPIRALEHAVFVDFEALLVA